MIKVVNLKKSFGAKPVLCGVNLTVEKGETMVVIGQSGYEEEVIRSQLTA